MADDLHAQKQKQTLQAIEVEMHSFIGKEIDQWDNINAKKPRTDAGYLKNRSDHALRIMEIVKAHFRPDGKPLHG